MNLASNSTPQELASMLAKLNDKTAHHMIWVDYAGDVHIEALPRDMAPVTFSKENEARIKFRFETLERGKGYVGPLAATDNLWVGHLYTSLVDCWKEGVEGFVGA
ncbi:MAG: hypothetical protein ABSB60_07490 [Terracidiphilus sp.]|jgi:hypothetical protein